ncbi:MAG: DUF4340 domain-containing protein [Clostridia bacterium]|nr:DUF4340 domain-containing protein [Clostridia bacterium]
MKRYKKLGAMLGVLLLLVIAALLQRQFFPEDNSDMLNDDGGSLTVYQIANIDEDNITALSYEMDGETLAFKKKEGGFVLDGENAPDVDTELISAMANAISNAGGKNKLLDVKSEKLVDYGLDDPSLTVKIEQGTKITTLLFGAYNKIAGLYYVADKNIPDIVYTVESSVYEAFDYSIEDLLVYDELPQIAAENINSLTISDVTLKKIKTPTDENEEGYTYSAERIENGKTEDYSYADYYKLCELISKWNIDKFAGFDDDSEDNIYGFENAFKMTVEYTERQKVDVEGASGGYYDVDKSITIILGGRDEEGHFYCKTEEDSPLVYKLSPEKFPDLALID